MGVIYKITNNINNKIYIGKTVRDPNVRWAEHKAAALSDDFESNPKINRIHLYRGMRKHGIENFTFNIIEENLPNVELSEAEIFYIDFFDSFKHGYNMTRGGDGPSLYDYEKIQEDYLNNPSLTNEELASRFNCSISTICSALQGLRPSNNKIIIQLDLSGNLLNEFPSTRVASWKVFNSSKQRSGILACCREEHYSAYGF